MIEMMSSAGFWVGFAIGVILGGVLVLFVFGYLRGDGD